MLNCNFVCYITGNGVDVETFHPQVIRSSL